MNIDEVLDVIRSLARTQGFYGRILAKLDELKENEPNTYQELVKDIEKQDFKDIFDVIAYFEG